MRLLLFALLTLGCTSFAGFGDAQWTEPKNAVTPVEERSAFDQGMREFELGAGALAGLNTLGNETRPHVGFALAQARFGWMLYTPRGTGFLRGNLEAILEGYGADIYKGPGSYLFGGGLIVRYNFVQPGARVVPFMQIMGGGAYSDAANSDSVQRLLGSDWSFSFGGEVGLRFMLTPRLALTGGVEYRHLSNADMATRNFGLNALGGTLELSWFY